MSEAAGTGVNQPLADETPDRRRGEGNVSFQEPLHPSPGLQTSESCKGEGVARAYLRVSPFLFPLSLPESLNLPVSDFLTLFPLFHEIPHPHHQMKGGRSAMSVS